jgi:hypothetical protein
MVSRPGIVDHHVAPEHPHQRRRYFLFCCVAYGNLTLVTTNVTDFWRRVPVHSRYSIVCVVLPNERLYELPHLLRELFRVPEFKTRPRRMGKIIRVSPRRLHYYERQSDPIIHIRTWSV